MDINDYHEILDYELFIENCRHKNYGNLLTHMHHIIPLMSGGANAPENLISLSVKDHFWAHIYFSHKYGQGLEHCSA